jgi:hypothetical protein
MESINNDEYYLKRRQQILDNIEKNNEDFNKIEKENIKILNNNSLNTKKDLHNKKDIINDNEYYSKRRQQILDNITKNNEDFYKIEKENIKIRNKLNIIKEEEE